MDFKELPNDIKLYITEFLDFKCLVCKKKIPVFEKHITIKEFHFCDKQCSKVFFIFPY